MAKYIDLHSHIHDKAFNEDRDALVLDMEKEGVVTITIGTDFEESRKALACAEKYENVFAAIGMHPVDNQTEVFDKELYRELAGHKRVVAIGECGLDYYWPTEEGLNFDKEKIKQKELFREHIALAAELDKPLMLHGRPSRASMDAYEEMLEVLYTAQKMYAQDRVRGNIHFFVGTPEIAKRFIAIGFSVSFSGVITFAKEYEELVKSVPIEMMHAETDSPYAAPLSHRGERNQPTYVKEIVAKIASLKGMSVEDVKIHLAKNAEKLFKVTAS